MWLLMTERLRDAESTFGQGRLLLPPDRMAEFAIHQFWHRKDAPQSVPEQLSGTIPAFVNDGRWIVQCECGGAQVASRNDKRFFCIDCLNVSNGGAWLKVTWPRNAEDIEAELLGRPESVRRSWRPGQTLKQLRDEG